MKTKLLSLAILSVVSLGAQAQNDSLTNGAQSEANLTAGTKVNRVYSTADGSKVKYAFSSSVRKDGKVCVSTQTHGLPEGAYTNWWMVFNNPEFCSNPRPFGQGRCGGPDVANPDVNATVMWATSSIVDMDGTAHFSSCVTEGELSHYHLMGSHDGLLDSSKAEVQVVVRYHGPIDPLNTTLLGEQLTTFGGGCANDAEGVEGFACNNLQVTVHPGPTLE